MKKIIITILIAVLFIPNISFAFNRAEIQEQYVKTLNLTISLLIKQVEELTRQLNEMLLKKETLTLENPNRDMFPKGEDMKSEVQEEKKQETKDVPQPYAHKMDGGTDHIYYKNK